MALLLVMRQWLVSVSHWLATGVAVMGGVITAQGLVALLSRWWRRGPGRRRDWIRRFEMLAPGVHIDYVREIFGSPAFQTPQPLGLLKPDTEAAASSGDSLMLVTHTWFLADDGLLHTISDENQRVITYLLTTTSRRFRPKVPMGAVPGAKPAFTVKLGVSRFSDLPGSKELWRPQWSVGARRLGYGESYYLGNRGGYVDWICAFNDAGTGDISGAITALPDPPSNDSGEDWLAATSPTVRATLEQARSGTVVNTVGLSIDYTTGKPFYYGADLDSVRMMARKRARKPQAAA